MKRTLSVVLVTGIVLGGCATGQPPRPTTPVYGRAPAYGPPPPPAVVYQAPPQYAPAPPPPPPAPAQYTPPPPRPVVRQAPPPQPVYQHQQHAQPAQPQYAQVQYADPQQQGRDTEECKAWAYQQTGFEGGTDAAKGAVVGGAIGALGAAAAGAAIGAISGGKKAAGKGAAIGAVAGGVGGAAIGGTYNYSKNKEGYEQAFAACMKGRGYAVGR